MKRWSLLAFMALFCPIGLVSQTAPVKIGTMDGPTEGVFGSVDDVVVAPSGEVLILDRQTSRVSSWSVSGGYLHDVGRRGSGPGEYLDPIDLAITSAGELLVLDQGNGKVLRFGRTAGRGRALVGEVRHGLPAQALCSTEGLVFLLSPGRERLVAVMDHDGAILREFALPHEPTAAERKALRGYPSVPLNYGRIACGAGRVLLTGQQTGVVRAFSLRGEHLWTHELSAFFPVERKFDERVGVCCRYEPNPQTGTADYLMGLVLVDSTTAYAVVSTEAADEPYFLGFSGRWLDLRSGAERRGREFDMWVHDLRPGRAIGSVDIPFPQVIISR